MTISQSNQAAARQSETPALARGEQFASRYGMQFPVMMAPMAGACPPALARAVAMAGGMGAVGSLLDSPSQIADWVAQFRAPAPSLKFPLPLQMNLWIPDPPPHRDPEHEAEVRQFLGGFGAPVPADAYDRSTAPLFSEQCEALLAARPTAVSSIMGLYPTTFVSRLKEAGISWFACVTTVAEARAAEQAGADVIVAQGAEAGGHRGAFDAADGLAQSVGLFALLPQVVDAVNVPVVATGGISDARGIAAAFVLGASAVQIGTGLLRSDEANVPTAWADAIAASTPERTRLTRAFSGRWGRAVASDYVLRANAAQAPEPAPYPVQRALTAAMRKQAAADHNIDCMQAWMGQGAALARVGPAGELVQTLWKQASAMLGAIHQVQRSERL